MLSTLLKAKLHMCTVTQAELLYDGSCAIDSNLLDLISIEVRHSSTYSFASNVLRFDRFFSLMLWLLRDPLVPSPHPKQPICLMQT